MWLSQPEQTLRGNVYVLRITIRPLFFFCFFFFNLFHKWSRNCLPFRNTAIHFLVLGGFVARSWIIYVVFCLLARFCFVHCIVCPLKPNTNRKWSQMLHTIFYSSLLHHWFEHGPGQAKGHTIPIPVSPLSTQHEKGKCKDWLTSNQDNASGWSYTSASRLLFQWASTIQI